MVLLEKVFTAAELCHRKSNCSVDARRRHRPAVKHVMGKKYTIFCLNIAFHGI